MNKIVFKTKRLFLVNMYVSVRTPNDLIHEVFTSNVFIHSQFCKFV